MKGRGAARSSADRGPHGSTVPEGGGDRSRTLRRSVRDTAAAAIGVHGGTNPTSSGEEHGGRLPRKKRTSVSWPRRGRRGLRLHRGVSSHGGSGTYGRRPLSNAHSTGHYRRRGLRPRPGSTGNTEQGRHEMRRDSCRGNVHRLNEGAEARWSLCTARGPKGQAAAFMGQEFGRRDPPVHRRTTDLERLA